MHLEWQRGVDHKGMESLPAVVQQHALDICRSVDYLLQPAHQHLGAFYLLFPARIAYLAMPRQSREAQWLAAVLQQLVDTSGFELARNIFSNLPV
jgi:hypothetical protein